MATSARTASLLAQRGGYNPYGRTGKIKLLSPANNSVASIAKKTANNELDIMVTKYNAGLITNQEMRDFLQKMQTNPGLSDVDRTDLEVQVSDFEQRIIKDDLETRYKAAPDNSLSQVQAAQALSNYYKNRAAEMQPGTPAYTTNIQNANLYDQRITEINEKMKTEARRNMRYMIEQEVNKTPSNTSERAQANAEKWKQLYDQAVADGDVTDANKFASYYQAELTKAQELSDSETTKENKKTLTDFLNTTINDYHDGKISGDEALAALQEADKFAYNIGDISAQNRINSLGITIMREIDKGITYSNVNGVSVKNKGGGVGGSGEIYLNPDGSVSIGGGYSSAGTGRASGSNTTKGSRVTQSTGVGGSGDRAKTLTEIDLEYKNNLIEANKALVNGEIVASSKNAEEPSYTQYVMLAAKERQLQLQNVVEGLSQIIAANPNTKQAKKLQETVDKYSTELVNVTNEYNGIRSGNLVLTMGSSDYTDVSGVKKTKPVLQFTTKGEASGYIDVGGIYYKPKEEDIVKDFGVDKAAANKFIKANPGFTLEQDEAGRYFVQGKKTYLDVADTNGNVITYENDATYGWLPLAVGPKTGALRQKLISETDEARKSGSDYTPKLLNYNEINKFDFNTPVGKTTAVQKELSLIDKVGDTVGNIVAPKVKDPLEGFKSPAELGVVAPSIRREQIDMPSLNTSIGSGTVGPSQPKQEPLVLAGKPTQANTAFKQTINPTGKTPVKISAPPIKPDVAKKNAEFVSKPPPQYTIGDSLKKLANTLSFGLLKF